MGHERPGARTGQRRAHNGDGDEDEDDEGNLAGFVVDDDEEPDWRAEMRRVTGWVRATWA
jgi:hypothetical protein